MKITLIVAGVMFLGALGSGFAEPVVKDEKKVSLTDKSVKESDSSDKVIVDKAYSATEAAWLVFRHEVTNDNKRKMIKENYNFTSDNKDTIVVKFSGTLPKVGPWGSGLALILPKKVEAGKYVNVSFRVRLLEGNGSLYLVRLFGGSDRKSIPIGPDWKECRLKMLLSATDSTNHLLFSLHDSS